MMRAAMRSALHPALRSASDRPMRSALRPASGCALHRVMPRARDERTNDTDGRSWSLRDPSLNLINARARVHPDVSGLVES